jgi:UDP-glucose:(heptosyl)LPS alpha-1,3-glucosyltransferase
VGLILAQDFQRKGLAAAIAAIARVADRRVMLLVGGKPDPARYQQLAQSLGVKDRVVFAGPVTNPAAFYRAADFFILPTRFDPCSLVVLEALAMGLPVVSTVKNGACEIMRDGIHGYVLADPDDLDAISNAVCSIAVETCRGEMSRACLALRPRLSQQTHIDQLEAVYQHVVDAKLQLRIIRQPTSHVR